MLEHPVLKAEVLSVTISNRLYAAIALFAKAITMVRTKTTAIIFFMK